MKKSLLLVVLNPCAVTLSWCAPYNWRGLISSWEQKTCAFRGFVGVDDPELRTLPTDFGVTESSTRLPLASSIRCSLGCPSIAESNCSPSSSSRVDWCTTFSFPPSINNSNSALYLFASVDRAPFRPFFFRPTTAFFFPLFPETGLNAGP